jgi:hypothetical protein
MEENALNALRSMRPLLRKRWEALLRAEPVTSPLANPDSLVYLMDWTLDRVFDELRMASKRRRHKQRPAMAAPPASHCECGKNPLLAYFSTAERSLLEAVFLADSPLPAMSPGSREACASELKMALSVIAGAEIETFCAVCLHRHCTQPANAQLAMV